MVKYSNRTEDTRGCEFPYTKYTTVYPIIWDDDIMDFTQRVDTIYCDDLGYNMEAETLNGLKIKMGKL
jgi:hypothetical protein